MINFLNKEDIVLAQVRISKYIVLLGESGLGGFSMGLILRDMDSASIFMGRWLEFIGEEPGDVRWSKSKEETYPTGTQLIQDAIDVLREIYTDFFSMEWLGDSELSIEFEGMAIFNGVGNYLILAEGWLKDILNEMSK